MNNVVHFCWWIVYTIFKYRISNQLWQFCSVTTFFCWNYPLKNISFQMQKDSKWTERNSKRMQKGKNIKIVLLLSICCYYFVIPSFCYYGFQQTTIFLCKQYLPLCRLKWNSYIVPICIYRRVCSNVIEHFLTDVEMIPDYPLTLPQIVFLYYNIYIYIEVL